MVLTQRRRRRIEKAPEHLYICVSMHFLYLFINGADDYFPHIVLKHFNEKKNIVHFHSCAKGKFVQPGNLFCCSVSLSPPRTSVALQLLF